MAQQPFQIVEDEAETKPKRVDPAIVSAVMLGIKALGQRALIAVADLFTLITALSVFWLWWSIPDPNPNQIVALSIYAVFILATNLIVRRSK